MIEEGMKFDDWKNDLHSVFSDLVEYVGYKENIEGNFSFPNVEATNVEKRSFSEFGEPTCWNRFQRRASNYKLMEYFSLYIIFPFIRFLNRFQKWLGDHFDFLSSARRTQSYLESMESWKRNERVFQNGDEYLQWKRENDNSQT